MMRTITIIISLVFLLQFSAVASGDEDTDFDKFWGMSLRADLNGDGEVNIMDLAVFAGLARENPVDYVLYRGERFAAAADQQAVEAVRIDIDKRRVGHLLNRGGVFDTHEL